MDNNLYFKKIKTLKNNGRSGNNYNACLFISIQQYLDNTKKKSYSVDELKKFANFKTNDYVDTDLHYDNILKLLNYLKICLFVYTMPTFNDYTKPKSNSKSKTEYEKIEYRDYINLDSMHILGNKIYDKVYLYDIGTYHFELIIEIDDKNLYNIDFTNINIKDQRELNKDNLIENKIDIDIEYYNNISQMILFFNDNIKNNNDNILSYKYLLNDNLSERDKNELNKKINELINDNKYYNNELILLDNELNRFNNIIKTNKINNDNILNNLIKDLKIDDNQMIKNDKINKIENISNKNNRLDNLITYNSDITCDIKDKDICNIKNTKFKLNNDELDELSNLMANYISEIKINNNKLKEVLKNGKIISSGDNFMIFGNIFIDNIKYSIKIERYNSKYHDKIPKNDKMIAYINRNQINRIINNIELPNIISNNNFVFTIQFN